MRRVAMVYSMPETRDERQETVRQAVEVLKALNSHCLMDGTPEKALWNGAIAILAKHFARVLRTDEGQK